MERIILGIDPGTRCMGLGVIQQAGSQLKHLHHEALTLPPKHHQVHRLNIIFSHTQQLIQRFLPDEMALEAPFYGKNAQILLKLGRAQGVAMVAALSRGIPVTEYAPSKVKLAITGSGRASKQQLAQTTAQLLQLTTKTLQQDAMDALAVAICHSLQQTLPQSQTKSWADFVRKNAHRICS